MVHLIRILILSQGIHDRVCRAEYGSGMRIEDLKIRDVLWLTVERRMPRSVGRNEQRRVHVGELVGGDVHDEAVLFRPRMRAVVM